VSSIGEHILDILDEVLLEDAGVQRFDALYLGCEEPLDDSFLQ
jgi:hypothetical protein